MASKIPRGQLLPLSVPLHTPQLRELRALRTQASELASKIAHLTHLQEQLQALTSEPRWDALVPIGPNSGLGYARGGIKDTKTVLVCYEGLDEVPDSMQEKAEKRQSGYWVEYTPEQAREAAARRKQHLQPRLEILTAAIAETEESLSSQMGFSGGHLNDKFELINEEGLPFVEIQELEEAEVEEPTGHTASNDPSGSITKGLVRSEPVSTHPSTQRPSLETNPAASGVPEKPRTSKKVSFAESTRASASDHLPATHNIDDDSDLPVIASEKAAISAGSAAPSSKEPADAAITPHPEQDTASDDTIKNKIVERDITKPPPVLTAAERSARKKTKWDVTTEFDGIEPRKVDLSAYLPRQLRGHAISKTFKISERSNEAQAGVQTASQADPDVGEFDGGNLYDPDAAEEDEDSDAYSFDEVDEEEDSDDNVHIDDILAMREAAMEYHARRHALGAGAGTGPLGGFGGQDDFEEPGPSEIDKGGLPFVETYDETDGQQRPSRFRKSRLETAHMVIPEIKPGDVEISESLLPGDSLGPFEDEEAVDAGEHGTNDFKGMSKEEIETFLRYVKALETGEDLQDLRIIAGGGDSAPDVQTSSAPSVAIERGPPVVKASTSTVPSVRSTVIEKAVETVPSVEKSTVAAATSSPSAPDEAEAEKPKRVSRFRAARGGG